MRATRLVVLALLASAVAGAQVQAPAPRLDLHPVSGPARLDLGHDLALALPERFFFLDGEQAKQVLAAFGNVPGEHLVGLVGLDGANWFVEVHFVDDGWVRDDDADRLDGAAVLDAIRDGTETANKVRVPRGLAPVRVDGWAEPPRYDARAHRLAWAVRGHEAGGEVVNADTRLLGRRGYVSFNLVVAPGDLAAARPNVETVIAATSFAPGARWGDYRPGERVAPYGLAALVAGRDRPLAAKGTAPVSRRWLSTALVGIGVLALLIVAVRARRRRSAALRALADVAPRSIRGERPQA